MNPILILIAAAAAPASTEETIIVTGTRAEEGTPADRIGGSVTVLDDQAIDRRQTREVGDILRDVPGVAVSRLPGQTQVRLRGAEGNHTLVLVDGIEVSDPFVGEFDVGGLLADEGAKIEVLRGQQSAIYGSDAIGGVIHYITLTGREAPGLSARAEAGSFGTVTGAARFAGLAGAVDYALSATTLRSQGTPNARNGSRDLDSRSTALSGKTTWAPVAGVRLTGVIRYSRAKSDYNDSDFTSGSPTFGLTIDSPGLHFRNAALYGLVRAEADLLDGRWSHAWTGQFANTDRDNFSASTRIFGQKGRRAKGSYETSLRLGTGPIHHRLTFALDAERETYRNTDPFGVAFTGWRHTDNIGLVGQYDVDIGEKAALGAALRHDFNDRFADATTYRLQGSYRLTRSTRLRTAAGSGVKNPGFYELFGFFDGRFIGNPGLKPERSQGWEAGIEQNIGRSAVGITYFDNRLKNEIFTAFPPPDFIATPANRTTQSKQRGIETFAAVRFGEAWRIDAAYTWLHARENGIEETRRAPHIASLAVDWRAPNDRGGINLVARYNGEQADDAFLDPSFIPTRVKLDDYLLVNLSADIRLGKQLSLFARAENLLDERYEQVFSFVSPGRAVYAGLKVRL